MDDLLTPVRTTYVKHMPQESRLGQSSLPTPSSPPQIITSAQQCLNSLRAQPDYDTLVNILNFLSNGTDDFSIWRPSPESAQAVSVLVGEIASNYWVVLKDDRAERTSARDETSNNLGLFLSCIRSLAGINAIVTKLRALALEARSLPQNGPSHPDLGASAALYLDLLSDLLRPHDLLPNLWRRATESQQTKEVVRKQLLSELVGLLAGGRLLSATAEVQTMVSRHAENKDDAKWWVADGVEFSKWLGMNVASWARMEKGESHGTSEEGLRACGMVWARGLGLGCADVVSKTITDVLLLSKASPPTLFSSLISALAPSDQKKIITTTVVMHLTSRFLAGLPSDHTSPNTNVSAVAGLLRRVVDDDAARKGYLTSWLTSASGAGLGEGIAIRRAVISALAEKIDDVLRVAEGTLGLFGDELYIKHSPILQQEAHAQVLLLAVGYLNRLAPLKVVSMVRTGRYLSTISNRIAATVTRSRFLGMVVGEALSRLVDGSRKQLKFGVPELETDEADWWRGLVDVNDVAGNVQELLDDKQAPEPQPTSTVVKPTLATAKPPKINKKEEAKPKPLIQIVDSDMDDSEGEDDLVPYAKPSDDPQDEDDDPAISTRNRPRPPVYILTLLSYLKATDDMDKQTLALHHGARLIRSKARHGTELTEHAARLASQLVSINDNFDIQDFIDLRLRCLVALVVADSHEMGPWMARALWEGDLSITQRVSLLIAMGVGAREIAGLQGPEEGETSDWVGERLPQKLEALYLGAPSSHKPASGLSLQPLPRNALDLAAQDLASRFLAPLAAQAADSTTGPDALKLSTFKSRLPSNTGGGSKAARQGMRPIPNTSSALLNTALFSPLHARLTYSLTAHRQHPICQSTPTLTTYIKTMGLILHAAGPSTLALPQMTTELWDLLLRFRVRCAGEMDLTGAVIAALVALLEVNDVNGPGGRRLCEEFGRQVIETREWVGLVFSGLRGEGEEESEVKALAAGVLVRLDEAVGKYRLLLMGSMI